MDDNAQNSSNEHLFRAILEGFCWDPHDNDNDNDTKLAPEENKAKKHKAQHFCMASVALGALSVWTIFRHKKQTKI